MSLSHPPLALLEKAMPLLKERESLQSQIEKIDRQLSEIENGRFSAPASANPTKPAAGVSRPTKRRRRRKNIQQAVLTVLKKAGPDGLNIKELAFRAKVKTTSLRTWLYTKGKTVSEIAPKGDGFFGYKSR